MWRQLSARKKKKVILAGQGNPSRNLVCAMLPKLCLMKMSIARARDKSCPLLNNSTQRLWWDSSGWVQGNDNTQTHFSRGTMHGRCLRIPFRNLEWVWWFESKEAGGKQGTERRIQSYFWSSSWCGIKDTEVFITQHYLVWNGSSVLKLPLNI